MAAERTIRVPKRPIAYTAMAVAAAAILACAVAATWRLSHEQSVAPMQVGER